MTDSMSFDRAASFYDATRKLPANTANTITQALLAEIEHAAADRLLEIGIGTGRIARPLMEAGVPMVGVDISHHMMAQLRGQLTAAHISPDLLLGDATRLPFRDGAFRAALVVHVLHLVASAPDAIAEIRRVLAPGGVLLQQFRRPDEEGSQRWQAHDAFWDAACSAGAFDRPRRRRQPHTEEIDRLLAESGAELSERELCSEEITNTVDEELARIATRENSWTWLIPDEVFAEALPAYEKWLRGVSDAQGRYVDRVTYFVQTARWP